MALLADRLGKLPRRRTVGVYLDEGPAEAWDVAVAAVEERERALDVSRARRIAERASAGEVDASAITAEIRAADDAELEPLRARVAETLAALDNATVWFTFRSLGRRPWRALLAEHPPTDADHDEAKAQGAERAQYHMDTLGPALVSACCIAPVLDASLVTEIFDGTAFNDSEIAGLVATAIAVNTQSRQVTHRKAPDPL